MATIVMTGGSSGFGAIAVENFTKSSGNRLLMGTRSPTGDDSIPVDLTRLESVRTFADKVRERLGDTRIDALVLNAGMILSDDTSRTEDGYETTFAVNHLAHYLLIRLLMSALADGAIVTLTTSGTHDPVTGAGLATPRHADADMLAHPENDPDRHTKPNKAGQHAYTASKLCSILTIRSFKAHPDLEARHITVIAYDPGQVFGTGLARGLATPMRLAWAVLGSPVGAPLRRLDRNLNTRAAAGETLARLALGTITPPEGQTYAALRRGKLTWIEPSELARRDDLAQALWARSAKFVGLPD